MACQPCPIVRAALPCCSPLPEEGKENHRSSWKRVQVYKRNPQGNYICDSKGNKRVFNYVEDTRTKNLYIDEDPLNIAGKCVGIILAMPFYTTATIAYNIIKIPFDIVRIAIDALKEFGKRVGEMDIGGALGILLRSYLWEIPKSAVLNLFEVVKAPIYGLAMQLSGIVGLFHPFEGRKFVAKVEGSWHHWISYKEDFRTQKTPQEATLTDLLFSKVIYAAICFQPRGNMKDEVLIIGSPKKYELVEGI